MHLLWEELLQVLAHQMVLQLPTAEEAKQTHLAGDPTYDPVGGQHEKNEAEKAHHRVGRARTVRVWKASRTAFRWTKRHL